MELLLFFELLSVNLRFQVLEELRQFLQILSRELDLLLRGPNDLISNDFGVGEIESFVAKSQTHVWRSPNPNMKVIQIVTLSC